MGNIKVSQLQEQATLDNDGYFYYVNGSENSRKVSVQTMRSALGGGGSGSGGGYALDITNADSEVITIPPFPANGTNIGYICKQITNGPEMEPEPSNFIFTITDIGIKASGGASTNYLVGVFAIVDSEGVDEYRQKIGITTNDPTQVAGKTYWKIKRDNSLQEITGDGSTAIISGTMFDRVEPMMLQSLFHLHGTSSSYVEVAEIDDPGVLSSSLGGWHPFSQIVYGSNLNVHKNNSSVVWSKNTKLCIACWSTTNNWSPSGKTSEVKIKYLKIPVV